MRDLGDEFTLVSVQVQEKREMSDLNENIIASKK
jgi:hypothetical protein